MSFTARFCGLAALVGTALVLAPVPAHATGAVLAPASESSPTTLDVRVAIAVNPYGTTRWAKLTVSGPTRVLWMVPAKPGAAADWASDAWLRALDDATAPRIVAPLGSPPCGGVPIATERAPTWGDTGTKTWPKAVRLHTTEADARARAAARGFAVPPQVGDRLDQVFGDGGAVLSLEIDVPRGATISTPTLRVSDDGPAALPLALTTSEAATARVTAFVIADTGAALPVTREVDLSALRWGTEGSSYPEERANLLALGSGALWVRESASHDVLFDGIKIPGDDPIAPLVADYFGSATGQARASCVSLARSAATATGTLGRACPEGALAVVPGGETCAPSEGEIDPAALTCGSGVDDLAIALSGAKPSRAVVSRFAGIVPAGALGGSTPIAESSAGESPVGRAGVFEPCPVTPPSRGRPAPAAPPAAPPVAGAGYVETSGGCSGDTSTTYGSSGDPYYDDSEYYDDSSDGCSGSTESASSSGWDDSDDDDDSSSDDSGWDDSDDDDSGWDTSDDDGDDDDDDSGWDDSDDATASSDSGGCSGSSSSSSSGWDESSARPSARRGHPKKHRGPSPVSRWAVLAVALLLPLRRRRARPLT